MDLPVLLSCPIPLPIRPSLWWWSITWHEEEKQGGEKGPPFRLRRWRSTSFFSSDFRHVMQLSKLMVPISSHSIHSQDRHAIQNVKPFLLGIKKSLWKVCWLSYEYFITCTQCVVHLKLVSILFCYQTHLHWANLWVYLKCHFTEW